MTTTFAAIPTTYNGVNYRSRLEARWAAFFTLMGWKFEYEPFDLNGWIPDFVLLDLSSMQRFVEVKPRLCDLDLAKCAVPGSVTLCVSAMPFDDYQHPSISEAPDMAMRVPFGTVILPDGTADVVTFTGYGVTTVRHGSGWTSNAEELRAHYTELWQQAGNAVQWRAFR